MDANAVIEFWSQLGSSTIHPTDSAVIAGEPDFATDLLPMPWSGPLLSAKTYFLFLNPGLSPLDHAYERDRADFTTAARENLKGQTPYLYLQSRFRDHPGARWANRVFGNLDESWLDKICVLQLVPYHSREGKVAASASKRLPSTQVIRSFVHKTIVPMVQDGKLNLVVARAARHWGFDGAVETANLVIYRASECRSAFQTPKSRGGQLLRRLPSASTSE